MSLILASSSIYRQQQLQSLGFDFSSESPEIDETRKTKEKPRALVERLAREKAEIVASKHPNAWVIGADQVAALDDIVMGKPGNAETARQMMHAMSGQTMALLGGIAVAYRGNTQSTVVTVDLTYRQLSDEAIDRYIALDQPFDCAAAMRSESRGLMLLESLRCDDPSAIMGLPLLALLRLLRESGFQVPV
ncbi:Maf family protein [Gammaproteobacteria bacterium]|nr:Maf family protein [Gammaproteobacteria bacterium]